MAIYVEQTLWSYFESLSQESISCEFLVAKKKRELIQLFHLDIKGV